MILDNINIITITYIAYLNVSFNLLNIATNINLEKDKINSCKYKSKQIYIYRDIDSNNIDSGKCFNNQITFKINVEQKIINIKLFNNGNLQLTGCKNKSICLNTINILINTLEKENKEFQYYNNENKSLQINTIYPCMINSKFNINFELDRIKTVKVLRMKNDIEIIRYNPSNYPGIVVKYRTDDSNLLTFLIFQSGKIMIMSAKTYDNIEEGYKYISNILNENSLTIKKTEYKQYIK